MTGEIPYVIRLRSELLEAIARRNAGRRRRVTAASVLLFIGVAVGAVVLLSAPSREGLPTSLTTPARSPVGSVPHFEPPGGALLAGGREVSLGEAEADTPFPVLRPDHALGSDQSVKTVWIREEEAARAEVALEYESGLAVIIRPAPSTDPVVFYERLLDQGMPGTVREINGAPSLVTPAGSAPGAPGSVHMVVEGSMISIIGDGPFSTDQLVEIAYTVRQ